MRINGGAPSLMLCAVLALTACGSESEKTSSEPTRTPTSGSTGSPGSSGDQPRVILVDAGAEPREELRVELAEGSTHHATMAMDMTMAIELDGRETPAQTLPTMTMGMLVEITEVSEGTARATFSYDEMEVAGNDATARQIEKGLQPLLGVTGDLEVTDRGEFVAGDFELPGDLDPAMESTLSSMSEQLRNLALPLPEEPVGVGAVWTVTTATAINGIEAENTYTYEIEEITDEGYVLDVSYETTAEEQDVDLPGVPASVTALLEKLEGSGEGQSVWSPSLVFPASSEVDAETEFEMTIDDGRQTGEMKQQMDLHLELSSE